MNRSISLLINGQLSHLHINKTVWWPIDFHFKTMPEGLLEDCLKAAGRLLEGCLRNAWRLLEDSLKTAWKLRARKMTDRQKPISLIVNNSHWFTLTTCERTEKIAFVVALPDSLTDCLKFTLTSLPIKPNSTEGVLKIIKKYCHKNYWVVKTLFYLRNIQMKHRLCISIIGIHEYAGNS